MRNLKELHLIRFHSEEGSIQTGALSELVNLERLTLDMDNLAFQDVSPFSNLKNFEV